MEKILDFQTREIPGEHARGNFRLLLSENETGINGLNAPIQLCGHGNTAKKKADTGLQMYRLYLEQFC